MEHMRLSNQELGIDVTAITNESIIMGCSRDIPQVLADLRHDRTMALAADEDRPANMNANMKPARITDMGHALLKIDGRLRKPGSPYFAR